MQNAPSNVALGKSLHSFFDASIMDAELSIPWILPLP